MDPEQLKKLDEYVRKVVDGASDISPIDRAAVKTKVDALYKLQASRLRITGDGNVKIIWCESPFQLMVMPFLFELVLDLGRNSKSVKSLTSKLTEPLWERALSSLLEQTSNDEFEKLEKSRERKLKAVAKELEKESSLSCKWPGIGRTCDYGSFLFWDGPQFRNGTPLAQTFLENFVQDTELFAAIVRHEEQLFRGSGFTIKSQVLRRIQVGLEPYADSDSNWFYLFDKLHWIVTGNSLNVKVNQNSTGFQIASLIQEELSQAFGSGSALAKIFEACASNSRRNRASVTLNKMLYSSIKTIHISQPDAIFLNGLIHHLSNERSRNQLEVDWASMELASSVFAFSAFERVCFVCDNDRKVTFDDRGRAHSEVGPALEFPDGYKLFAWHGVVVPQDVIEQPETINVERIESERNAEVRRVLIERFGAERFILESGAYLMDADYCGNLYSKSLSGDEPLVMVEVTNSTAEPDGTLKRYYLRVPPEVTSAREAVAWTFGMREEEYFPLVET